MQEPKYKNVIIDTHNYLNTMEYLDIDKFLEGHKQFIKNWFETKFVEFYLLAGSYDIIGFDNKESICYEVLSFGYTYSNV